MPDNDRIVDEELINELRQYRDAFAALSPEAKASLLVDLNSEKKPTSAKALAEFLKNLNPEETTYGQVRTLAKLFHATRDIPAAYQVLNGFEGRKLNYSITRSMASLGTNFTAHVDQFFEQKDKSHVQLASKAFFFDDSRKNRLGQALLSHVIKGNQDTVVAMLRRYPKLLLYRGNVVDYSGREFKNVAALELATWALDVRYMAPAMLKCVTDNEARQDYSRELAAELQEQFDNVVKEGGGVNYTIGCGLLQMSEDPTTLLPGKTDEERYAELNRKLNRHDGLIQYQDKLFYFHNLKCPKELVEITNPDALKALQELMNKKGRELTVEALQIINHDDELKLIEKNVPDSRHIFREKHYDFTPLTEALEVYVKSFDFGNNWKLNQRETHWCTVVGLAQHYAPAHVAQHYCNPDESFDPKNNYTPPTFKEKVLKRVLTFYHWSSATADNTEPWWPSSGVSLSGSNVLSLDFGIFRAGCWRARRDSGQMLAGFSRADLTALTALCKVRTDDARELKQLLDSLQKPGTGSEPARAGPL